MIKSIANIFLLIIFCSLIISMPSYGLLEWTPTNGPCGGHITRLDIGEDGTIYAGTWGGGIFRLHPIHREGHRLTQSHGLRGIDLGIP